MPLARSEIIVNIGSKDILQYRDTSKVASPGKGFSRLPVLWASKLSLYHVTTARAPCIVARPMKRKIY